MVKGEMIKLYSAPASPGCEAVRRLLAHYRVSYQDFNVTVNSKAMKEWMKMSPEMEVPVIEINGGIVIGFDPARLKAKLGLSRIRSWASATSSPHEDERDSPGNRSQAAVHWPP
jgi:glutaredoxin 3